MKSSGVSKIQKMVTIGMLGAIGYVLMIINFPFPGFPTFLQIDFSDIPALIAAIIFGPVAGILVELLKNILDYMMTGSDTGIPIGHFANFIGGVAFILPAYYFYKKIGTKRGMVYGLVGGTIVLALFMSLVNYFILLPSYSVLMNWNMSGTEIRAMITTAIIPFNLIKGTLIAIVFMLLFTKMQGWFSKQSVLRNV
ncbi:ECF transporter S component [Pradoshia sp. D12]|uniref:ECF transporter S component n=1 Tax=Bacillaceae TaxID=186817 RepID=UPI00080AD250|nr:MULTISPECIES: ECF transporter S component [Bacillaceae]OCA83599.1 riboflavin transporter FmnP [Bacillus sp. FJAT-27986]QFK71840.1 ECF transporter S component [Pradoshia sp. D12]TPF73635.1 ECF transporter S component [Bacillus sp. D12]